MNKNSKEKKIYFTIPKNLNLKEICENTDRADLIKDIPRMEYIISKIVHKKFEDDRYKNDEDYIRLKFDYLGKVINQKKVKILIDFLIKTGIIECDNHYIKGGKSKGYNLTKKYRDNGYRRILVSNKFILKNLKKLKLINEQNIESDYILSKTKEQMQKVCIHPVAKEYVKKLIGKPHPKADRNFTKKDTYRYLSKIRAFNNHEWYLKRDVNTGRVFNNITNMPKVVREFMQVNGEPLIEIDISNAQPLMLLKLIDDYFNYAEHLKEDFKIDNYLNQIDNVKDNITFEEFIKLKYGDNVKAYKKIVQDGTFYQYLIDTYNEMFDEKISKKNLKISFYTLILFSDSKDSWKSKLLLIFKKMFPDIWTIICKIKEINGYKYVSKQLQTLEAKLMIENIYKSLLKEHSDIFLLPIHDAIITQKKHSAVVINKIKETFSSFGLDCSIKINEPSQIFSKLKNKTISKTNHLFNIFINKTKLNQLNKTLNKYHYKYIQNIYTLMTTFLMIRDRKYRKHLLLCQFRN